jgi:hypothetical protein
VRERIQALGLSTSHHLGKASNRGRRLPGRYRIPLDEALVRNSSYTHTSNLRERLFAEGLKARICERCRRTTWNGRPIPLQLDHINGDRRDNRLENLRILCANGHSQTDTYCGRNVGRYDEA